MLLKDKKVAIIGAGPVGLTMARLLQQNGVVVSVYERDKDPLARIWGGTLDLHKDSGQEAMKKAGLLEQYYKLAIPMGIMMTDEQGRVLSTVPAQYDNPEINRNELRKMLLASLTNGTVVWDSKCIGVEVCDGQWLLQFDHQQDEKADLVIVANGGMSGVRHFVTDTQVEESGTFIIQGEVPQPELHVNEFYTLCAGNRLMAARNGNLLVANPYNNGMLSYGVIFKKAEDWNRLNFQNAEIITDLLIERFSQWNDHFHHLFRSTSLFVGLPIRKLPLNQPWKSDRPLPITLIGDAAHLMPPFAGKGVNTGMLDALILTDNLICNRFETLQAAISEYEEKMFAYATAAQLESGKNEMEMRKPDFSFRQLIH